MDETPTEATESKSDVYIFKGEDSETDEDLISDDVGQSNATTHLSVVKCALTTSLKIRSEKSATFHMFTKNEDKSCKVIVDSESCIYAISLKSLEYLELEVIPHPHPFKVSWID